MTFHSNLKPRVRGTRARGFRDLTLFLALGALLAAAAAACDQLATAPRQRGVLLGRVRGSDMGPVAGAQLTLERAGSPAAMTVSNVAGYYTFGSLDAGVWTVSVTPPDGFGPQADEPLTADVTVADGENATHDFRLATNQVTVVLDDNHQFLPCTGDSYYSTAVRATLSTPEGQMTGGITRDGDDCVVAGTYAFTRVPAGTWQLGVALGPDLELAPGQEIPTSVTVVPGGDVRVEFAVLSQFLFVTVTDPLGNPVDRAMVRVMDANGNVAGVVLYTTNDEESPPTTVATRAGVGTFALQLLPPDGYDVAPGQQNPVSVTVGPGDAPSVRFTVVKTAR